jgi:hypothetical protein
MIDKHSAWFDSFFVTTVGLVSLLIRAQGYNGWFRFYCSIVLTKSENGRRLNGSEAEV